MPICQHCHDLLHLNHRELEDFWAAVEWALEDGTRGPGHEPVPIDCDECPTCSPCGALLAHHYTDPDDIIIVEGEGWCPNCWDAWCVEEREATRWEPTPTPKELAPCC